MPLEGIQNIHPVRLWSGLGLRSYGFIPAFKHVGSVVRGKQLFVQIRGSSELIFWPD
jgi:hypothetical protein